MRFKPIRLWHDAGRCIRMSNNDRYTSTDFLTPFRTALQAIQTHAPLEAGAEAIKIYYRLHPDGRLRWIWPAGLNKPLFLKCYYEGSLRSKWIGRLIRMLFAMRLGRWFATGEHTLHISTLSSQSIQQQLGNQWAFFAGTPGVHQSAVFYTQQTQSFIKIPIGQEACQLMKKEYTRLMQTNQASFRYLVVPRVSGSDKMMMQTDLSVKRKRSERIGTPHWKAMGELACCQTSRQPLQQWHGWTRIRETLQNLPWHDERFPKGLFSKLNWLANQIDSSATISCSLAHGDFTPWNVFVSKEQLGVIDWEQASDSMPLFFDMYHFIYQQSSLVSSDSYNRLLKKIEQALKHPVARVLEEEHRVQRELHHRLYLLYIISYYLPVYQRQSNWHPQVYQSLRIWSDALTHQLSQVPSIPHRSLLLLDMFDFLGRSNYAALKWRTGNPADLPVTSDVDLCMPNAEAKCLLRYWRQHTLVKSVHTTRKSFMLNMQVRATDHSALSVDAIWRFQRKSLNFLSAQSLLGSATPNAFGVKQPAPVQDFMYTWLFYGLNGQSLPEKYQRYFTFFSGQLRKDFNRRLPWLTLMHKRDYTELFQWSAADAILVRSRLAQQPENRGWQRLRNKVLYGADCLRSWMVRPGFSITISGVDGAGKSTILQELKEQVEKSVRRPVVVLRHRPALLPMLTAWQKGRQQAEQDAALRLPRQGTNRKLVSSLLRFGYYYIDYLLGQFVVYWKYNRRGYVVMYDRYYFDFISDGRRSNLELPVWLTRSLYRFLLKPNYNFFLYADADEILRRKQELDRNTITSLTRRYLQLFHRLQQTYRHSMYVPVENRDKAQTIQQILKTINRSA